MAAACSRIENWSTLPAPDEGEKRSNTKRREGAAVTISEEIMLTFRRVAREQGRQLAPLQDELMLSECGLDSLGFSLVVISLEESLKVDPFDTSEEVDFPLTLRDFIALYERHLA
jgi:hypothetical protein